MRMTVGQLRRLIKEVVGSSAARSIKIGYLNANIAGDYRYTDSLSVMYNPDTDTVKVTVSETGSAGGMDSFYGTTEPAVDFSWMSQPGASAAEIARVIRDVLGNTRYNFKRYGKPTKNFNWVHTRAKGFSVANLVAELQAVRDLNKESEDFDEIPVEEPKEPVGGSKSWSDDPWWKK